MFMSSPTGLMILFTLQKKNHDQSVLEPGNLRFDILQSKDDPCYFTLYEAYQSEESAKAHKETSHYLEWKNSVEPWMAEPRKGVPFSIIAPSDLKGWGK